MRRLPRLMSSLTPSTFPSPSLLSSTRSFSPSLAATWLLLSMSPATPPTLTTPSPSTLSTPHSRSPPSPSRSRTTRTLSLYQLLASTISPQCCPVRLVRPLARASRSLSLHSRTARLRECGPTPRSSSTRRLLCFPSPCEPREFKSGIYDIVEMVN